MPAMLTPLISEPIIILTLVGWVDVGDLRAHLAELARYVDAMQGPVYRINDVYDLRLSEREWGWLTQAYRQSEGDAYSQLVNLWVSETPLSWPAIPLEDRAPIFADFSDALRYARTALYGRQSRRGLWQAPLVAPRPWLGALFDSGR